MTNEPARWTIALPGGRYPCRNGRWTSTARWALRMPYDEASLALARILRMYPDAVLAAPPVE